jgi:hypothetical protein
MNNEKWRMQNESATVGILRCSFVISHFPFLNVEAETFREVASSLLRTFRPRQPFMTNSQRDLTMLPDNH